METIYKRFSSLTSLGVPGEDVRAYLANLQKTCEEHANQEDLINDPEHYQGKDGMQSIDVIEEFELNFNLGNVIKYVLRSGKKGSALQDLLKAQWYLERQIENLEQEDDECDL